MRVNISIWGDGGLILYCSNNVSSADWLYLLCIPLILDIKMYAVVRYIKLQGRPYINYGENNLSDVKY